MSFYQHLLQLSEQPARMLQSAPLIQQAFRGDVSRVDYVAFLTEAYHHVKHTVPLLMACGARLPESKEWLREAVAEYIEEELGHQEWILNDLAACGVDPETVRHSRPSVATELMVAYAYDLIHRVNPLGFFGMVHVLESTSTQLADAAAGHIAQATGLPPQAFSYLRSHGGLDITHVAFFQGLMDRITDPADQACISDSATRFYFLYGNVFRTLPEQTAQAAQRLGMAA